MYLAIHLLPRLGPKHLGLVLLRHALKYFPVGTEAVLVDASVRTVVALVVGTHYVLRSLTLFVGIISLTRIIEGVVVLVLVLAAKRLLHQHALLVAGLRSLKGLLL